MTKKVVIKPSKKSVPPDTSDSFDMEYVDKKRLAFHDSTVKVRAPNTHPDSVEFYPTALIADKHIVTYIAGTPVVTSPYLGARPAFDGSDYIVNVSSINRDVRLMETLTI